MKEWENGEGGMAQSRTASKVQCLHYLASRIPFYAGQARPSGLEVNKTIHQNQLWTNCLYQYPAHFLLVLSYFRSGNTHSSHATDFIMKKFWVTFVVVSSKKESKQRRKCSWKFFLAIKHDLPALSFLYIGP